MVYGQAVATLILDSDSVHRKPYWIFYLFLHNVDENTCIFHTWVPVAALVLSLSCKYNIKSRFIFVEMTQFWRTNFSGN